jgi:hypothetical protein
VRRKCRRKEVRGEVLGRKMGKERGRGKGKRGEGVRNMQTSKLHGYPSTRRQ